MADKTKQTFIRDINQLAGDYKNSLPLAIDDYIEIFIDGINDINNKVFELRGSEQQKVDKKNKIIQTLTKNFDKFVSDITKEDQETKISFQLDTNTLITVGKQFDSYDFSD